MWDKFKKWIIINDVEGKKPPFYDNFTNNVNKQCNMLVDY